MSALNSYSLLLLLPSSSLAIHFWIMVCMSQLEEILTRQLAEHPIDFGTSEASAILEFLYIAYCESRESDPPEIKLLFAQLGVYLEALPLDTNNAMFFIIIKLCTEHERRAFEEGIR